MINEIINLNICNGPKRILPKEGMPNIHRFLCYKKMGKSVVSGSGFSLNQKKAQISSLGEFIERYAAINDTGKIKYTEGNVDNRLNLEKVTKSNDVDELNIKRIWVEGNDVLNKKKIMVPYEMVYLKSPNYSPIRDIISTGLSAHTDMHKMFIGGLQECIERDAFVLFWLLGKVNFKIDIYDSGSYLFNNILDIIKASNIEIYLYDITTNLKIPTILTVLKGKKKGFYMGCASNLNYTQAIINSIEEALGGYSIYSEAIYFNSYNVPKNKNEIFTLKDRPIYYLTGKGDYILEKLIDPNVKTLKYRNIKNNDSTLQDCINQILKLDYSLILVNITPKSVLDLGFYVGRVIIPELCFLSTGKPLLNSVRLNERIIGGKDINLEPHPFP